MHGWEFQNSRCSTSSPALGIFCLFCFNHPGGYVGLHLDFSAFSVPCSFGLIPHYFNHQSFSGDIKVGVCASGLIALAVLGPLHFHWKFAISLPICIKQKTCWDFGWDSLNSEIHWISGETTASWYWGFQCMNMACHCAFGSSLILLDSILQFWVQRSCTYFIRFIIFFLYIYWFLMLF